MSTPSATIGVVGAGTMGAGIAQLACVAGAVTRIHDSTPGAAEAALVRITANLDRLVQRGRLEATNAQAALRSLHVADGLEEFADCALVVEAVPEDLATKHALVGRLDAVIGHTAVIATNTSSLSVTAIASASARPERVVGMHFFNPPPVMRLVEIVAGEDSAAAALELAEATARSMGKATIRVKDTIGFVVNRGARPFNLEALSLLSEGVATIEEIDLILRQGGGFAMGAFELMDLVGVDVAVDVATSFYEQSFHEPRWRPSTIAARQVAAGRLGRKTERGYYDYRDGPHRSPDPEAPPIGGGSGTVCVAGTCALSHELRRAATDAGWTVTGVDATVDVAATVVVDCDGAKAAAAGLRLVLLDRGSLAACEPTERCVGFFALSPFAAAAVVELARTPRTADDAVDEAERFFATLGKRAVWVGDAPGLVLGRVVAQLVNEAAFALQEGVASPADLDTGATLGLNHPRGPIEWSALIGPARVLSLLDALHRERGDDRYRAAARLRAVAGNGVPLTSSWRQPTSSAALPS